MFWYILRGFLFSSILLAIGYTVFKLIYSTFKKEQEEDTIIYENKYFYLKQAVLCPQCDCLFNRKDYPQCPSCGTEISFAISSVFQPPKQKVFQQGDGI